LKGEKMTEKNTYTAVNMLIKINRMHKRMIGSVVCNKIGLHQTQHIILMHLAKRETLPSQKELAEHLNITPAAVTGALQKLEADGYIRRNIGTDNRYNEITITEFGKSVVEKTKVMFSHIDELLFSGFSDEEIGEFTAMLEKIHLNIENYEKEGAE
jgi:DNA-binding MarR family transcriptional regulator